MAVLVLAVTVYVIMAEQQDRLEWKQYQASYNERYADILEEKINQARQAGQEEELSKWEKLSSDLKRSGEIKVRDVFLPGAQVRDLCLTCHVAVKNDLFAEAENPLKAHPPEILRDHKISRFGCTLCHHGQGVGLKTEKAHGFEENWEKPKLPMKYIESSCFECHETVYGLKGAERGAAGKKVFTEFGCYGCHEANVINDLPKFSTPFSGLSQKIKKRQWIFKWLEDPSLIRPGTLMPDFRIDAEKINNIISYIYPLPDPELKLDPYWPGSSTIGRKLFTDKGCIGCHSPDREDSGLSRRVPLLSDAGLKMKDDWLLNWIRRPRDINPDTWMPEVTLTGPEVQHLTAYLKTLQDKTVAKQLSFDMDKGDAEEGKTLIQSLGCLGCHRIKGKEDPSRVGISVADVADKRMEELPFGDSEVEHTKWDWIRNKIKKPVIYQTDDMPMYMPDYDLDEQEIEVLTIFYLYNRLLDLPEDFIVRTGDEKKIKERGDWMLEHFNCRGCHEIIDQEKPRIEGRLDKKSLEPPRIVDELEKVQPEWLFDYLREPTEMRPWLHIRMPQFDLGYEETIILIKYLHRLMPEEKETACEIPYEQGLVQSNYDPETIEMGKYRFRNDKCMQCHPVDFTGEPPEGKKLEDLSIDLMLSKDRLRYQWIIDFMRNPDKYAGTSTKMPFVFYTPDGVPRIPDPETWLRRTALFLMFMEEVPEPVKAEEKTREVQEFDFDNY
ncbi:MAG: c-type cytochrome [Desulfosudaceae bacterium]